MTPASRTLHTRIPPPLFLTLSLFLLQNIDHCCVIFPISLSSPAALSSPASRTPPAPFCPGRPPYMNGLWIIYCFVSGGKGGGDVWGRWCRGPNLPPPTPCLPGSLPFYLDFLPLGLLPLRNIEHYIVA